MLVSFVDGFILLLFYFTFASVLSAFKAVRKAR